MKVGIYYFSWKGNTRLIAELLAKKLNADLLEIREEKERKGVMGFFKGVKEAMFNQKTDIVLPERSPETFELVIIGSPVWAGKPAPAVISFLEKVNLADKKTVLFLTQGASKNKYMDTFKTVVEAHQANVIGSFFIANAMKKDKEELYTTIDKALLKITGLDREV